MMKSQRSDIERDTLGAEEFKTTLITSYNK